MARQIIVLDIAKKVGSDFTVTAAFWLVAPTNRVKPVPSFVSAVPASSAVAWGVTTAEAAALANGTVVEQVLETGQFPSGTLPAAVQAALVTAYGAAQNALNAQAASRFIGASFDGSIWSAAA